jgi:hypothetical protein
MFIIYVLSVVDWDGIFRNDDIDIITNTITNTILDATNKTIPNRCITVKKDIPHVYFFRNFIKI